MPGKIELFPARESLVTDIPAGDWKNFSPFLQCIIDGVSSQLHLYAYGPAEAFFE
jgi:hypothetical protein